VNNISFIYNFLIDIVKRRSILSPLLPLLGNSLWFYDHLLIDCG